MGPLIYWPPLGHLGILLAVGAVCLLRLSDLPQLPDAGDAPAPAPVTAMAESTLFPLPEVGAYDDILPAMDARPLFLAGRRPADAAAAPVQAAASKAPEREAAPSDLDLRLMAVIGQGADRRALVIATGGEGELWVQTGDDVAGWQVTAIGPRTLDLQLGDRSATVDMFH